MVEKFKIRLADISDIKNVFDLSNDEMVRKNSINKEKILWKNHVEWYNKRIKNTEYPFYIVEDSSGNFVAQARFDKNGSEITVSISLTEKFRGLGLGSKIIELCTEHSGFTQVNAYIFDYNTASIKSFIKAGFKNTHLLKFERTTERERERERESRTPD